MLLVVHGVFRLDRVGAAVHRSIAHRCLLVLLQLQSARQFEIVCFAWDRARVPLRLCHLHPHPRAGANANTRGCGLWYGRVMHPLRQLWRSGNDTHDGTCRCGRATGHRLRWLLTKGLKVCVKVVCVAVDLVQPFPHYLRLVVVTLVGHKQVQRAAKTEYR